MIQVTGILLSPTNRPMMKIEIRITSKTNELTLKGVRSSIITDTEGKYDFELLEGEYTIEILLTDEYVLSGLVKIDIGTSSPLSLPQLLDLL